MNINKAQYPSMMVRNIRYRYPIASSQVNDILDEIYYNIVELLGYQNQSGAVQVNGVLRELYNDIDDEMESNFGAIGSAVSEAFTLDPGEYSNNETSISYISNKLKAVLNS